MISDIDNRKSEPHRQYELAVVGAMMLSTRFIEQMRLTQDHFRHPDTKRAFERIREAYIKGKPIDIITIKAELGGTDAAANFLLTAMECCPAVDTAPWYERKLREEHYLYEWHDWVEKAAFTL